MTSTIKDVSTIRIVGKDTGKIFKITADDDKVHLSSEFEKTLIDNLYFHHDGEEKHLSTHLTGIQVSVSDETQRATSKENELKADYEEQLTVEKELRLVKDSDLQSQIVANKAHHDTVLVATQTVLTGLIETETDRATARESEISDSVAQERDRAEQVENALQADLTAESARATTSESIITASVLTEKNRAIAQESQLTESLATEVSDRIAKDVELDAKDTELTQALNNEITRASASEQSEEVRAKAAEQLLNDNLMFEINRAQTREASLQNTINNIISNVDPAALDSLTEIVQKMNEVDSSAYSRIYVLEEYLKQVFDLESLYPLKVSDMAQLIFDIATHAQIFPDEQAPSYCEGGGWKYINDAPGKINWYFVGQGVDEHKTLEDYSGLYAKVKLDSVDSLPFFNIYTKAKGDGSDAGSWYGSRRTFVFPANHGLTSGDECLMYYGTDIQASYSDIPHIQLVLDNGSSNGTDDDSQELFTVAFATNSAAVVNSVNLCAKAFIVGDGKHTHIELTSSPPPPSTQISITTTPGAYPTELWASITTGEDGTGDVVWSQGTSKFVNSGPLPNITTTVPTGQQLYFNAYDTWGDGWNGATYSVTRVSDGTVLSDNGGMSPNESGELSGSFSFTA